MAGGMRIVTNVAALQGVVANTNNSSNLQKSLERLSTGLKINAAKDNASGMAIANQLKTQASSLGAAIDNGNQANSVLLTADKAIEEQSNILDQIKQKAITAAQDGQSTKTRNMLQADIIRLMEELDNIANTTSFNGKNLLSGGFSNQEFQIGDRSNITVKTTIGSTQSSKLGVTRFETGSNISASANMQLTLKQYDGIQDFKYAAVKISYSVNTGVGALAEEINRNSGTTGVRASYNVTTTGVFAVRASSTADDFSINGVLIGKVDYQDNDQNGALVNAINAVKDTTGVEASIDANGRLSLTSADGRAVFIDGGTTRTDNAIGTGSGIGITMYKNFGRLSLVKNSGSDILLSGVGYIQTSAGAAVTEAKGASAIGFGGASRVSQYSMSLRETKMQIGIYQQDALGMNSTRFGVQWVSGGLSAIFNQNGISAASLGGLVNFGAKSVKGANAISVVSHLKPLAQGALFSGSLSAVMTGNWQSFNSIVRNTAVSGRSVVSFIQLVNQTAGVTTLKGAMAMMDIVETAILNVDQIRANIGSAQQQIDSTINNISTTQVNLKSAESVIRDLDFASESANYSKSSILAQSGAYALAQANASSQYVMQLLQ
mgnify:CR=1 FL=1